MREKSIWYTNRQISVIFFYSMSARESLQNLKPCIVLAIQVCFVLLFLAASSLGLSL